LERQQNEQTAFARFIRDARKQKKISNAELSKGICSVGFLSALENGKRSTNFLLMERILGRVGIDVENFVFLVGDGEYQKWNAMKHIFSILRKGEFQESKAAASRILERWEAEDKLICQFGLHVLAMVEKNLGGSKKKRRDLLTKALNLTVPDPELSLKEGVLSVQELDIMLDLEECQEQPDPEKIRAIGRYVLQVRYEERCQAKIFPKVVVRYCNCAGTSAKDQLEMLDDALFLLRKKGYTYYMWEILNLRKGLLRNTERLEENNRWIKNLEELYAFFGVPIANTESLIVYDRGEIKCIRDVVVRRRRMLGMTAEQLSRDCCSMRTLQRIENNGTMPQGEVMEALFKKLKLPCCVVHEDMVFQDMKGRELFYDFSRQYSKQETDMTSMARRLSDYGDSYSAYNRQYMMRLKNVLAWLRQDCKLEELLRRTEEALGVTINFDEHRKYKGYYFTYCELLLLTDVVRTCPEELEKRRRVLNCICRQYDAFFKSSSISGMANNRMNFVMSFVESELGDMGEYQLSNSYCRALIDADLRRRCSLYLSDLVYNYWWNKWKMNPATVSMEELSWCCVLAELGKDSFLVDFFKKKIEELKD